jgi:hypothetical protein
VITTDVSVYQSFTGVRINYSEAPVALPEVHLRPHGLLAATGTAEVPISTFVIGDTPAFFASGPGYALPFDPLAASFFLLSRYEEYLPFTPDGHGRYPAQLSWAVRSGCLQRPVVMVWALLLAEAIQRVFPGWVPVRPGYRFLPTLDVDLPWAFRHRGLRGLVRAGLEVLQGQWPMVRARLNVFWGGAPDPYFTFPQLQELHEAAQIRPRIFWLLGDRSRHDVNPPSDHTAYQQLIRHTDTWSDSGIHPSYRSFGSLARLRTEQQRLARILGQPVTHSRQHFLRLQLPQTYQQLLAAGLRHDYTMGYAEAPGYRAGTTEPFRWYDLSCEQTTDLWVHPFVAMDVTLQNYQGLSATAAAACLQDLQTYCRREQLSFAILWHNSSFSALHGWAGWWAVYAGLFVGESGNNN